MSIKRLLSACFIFLFLSFFVACGQWYSKYGIKDDKELNSFRAVPKLMKALDRGTCYDGMRAADALVVVGEQARSAFFSLEHFMKRPDCSLRQRTPAAIALGQLGKPAFNILLKAMNSKDGKIRFLSVLALGYMKYRQADAIVLLNRKIDSDDPLDQKSGARLQAFESLGKHGEAAYKSIPLLVKLLSQEHWQVPSMDCLVAIGVPSRMALDALKALADKSPDAEFKAQVMSRYKALLSNAGKAP